MPLPNRVSDVIVPVVTVYPSTGRVEELWGTAFFVRPHLLMTAKHVLSVTISAEQRLGVVHDGDSAVHLVNNIYLDPMFDIAVGRVDAWASAEHLSIAATDTLHFNRGLIAAEYSATEQHVPLPNGDSAMKIAANWHQGHFVRTYIAEFGHKVPTSCMDLSYPAFKRASGAPVMHADTGEVVGMIVANVERHLLPAHLERTERPDGVVEDIRYFSPNAQAIRANHLRDCLASFDQNGTSGSLRAGG